MSSKKDYDKVINRMSKRRPPPQSISAGLEPLNLRDPIHTVQRQQGQDYINSSKAGRIKGAKNEFDNRAKIRAKVKGFLSKE